MNDYIVQSPFEQSLSQSMTFLLTEVITFLPKLALALLVTLVGIFIARTLRSLVISSLSSLRFSKNLEKTPLAEFLHNAEVKSTAENVIGGIVYWILILFIAYTVVTILGLDTASAILNHVVFYIPHVFSAVVILIVGVLLAGLAETLVKGTVKSVDPQTGRFLGKVTSYLIIVLSAMAAISELGIAQQFIMILFTGFVTAVSLAVGLAFGLGSKHTVERMMMEWYEKMKRDE